MNWRNAYNHFIAEYVRIGLCEWKYFIVKFKIMLFKITSLLKKWLIQLVYEHIKSHNLSKTYGEIWHDRVGGSRTWWMNSWRLKKPTTPHDLWLTSETRSQRRISNCSQSRLLNREIEPHGTPKDDGFRLRLWLAFVQRLNDAAL